MEETASLESYLFHRHRRPQLERPGEPWRSGTDVVVRARDGYPLAATIFDPPDDEDRAERVVVVASATGVRRGYYGAFSSWLAQRGTRVVTFDYRGIGGSRPERLRSFDASLVDWAELDLGSVIEWAAARFGRGRTCVVGHSVGGQLLGLVPDVSAVRAVVMVASQSGDYRLWPSVADRARFVAFWHALVPGIASALGYLPGALGIGEDLPGGVAREWARWCRTPGYMVGGDGHARRDLYRRVTSPILAFGFDDDDYAPPATVGALLELYENAPVTRRQISTGEAKVGHFGFFRERFASTFWKEAEAFLLAHARPVASA